jgi:hypothetical protein
MLSIKLRYHLPVVVELFLRTAVGATQEILRLIASRWFLEWKEVLAWLFDRELVPPKGEHIPTPEDFTRAALKENSSSYLSVPISNTEYLHCNSVTINVPSLSWYLLTGVLFWADSFILARSH